MSSIDSWSHQGMHVHLSRLQKPVREKLFYFFSQLLRHFVFQLKRILCPPLHILQWWYYHLCSMNIFHAAKQFRCRQRPFQILCYISLSLIINSHEWEWSTAKTCMQMDTYLDQNDHVLDVETLRLFSINVCE